MAIIFGPKEKEPRQALFLNNTMHMTAFDSIVTVINGAVMGQTHLQVAYDRRWKGRPETLVHISTMTIKANATNIRPLGYFLLYTLVTSHLWLG